MSRALAAAACVAVAGLAIYWLGLREKAIAPNVRAPIATAAIGSGPDAVAVGRDGRILAWMPPPEEGSLPLLPLASPPDRGRLSGPALQQAKVLGAAPDGLRPHIAGSEHGDSGINVELWTGIELRFGDASRARQKWSAAAAVLANPAVEALDYVDLQAPRRPALGGSGHTLPPLP